MKTLKFIVFTLIISQTFNFAQTEYRWTGAVNSSFSTAGNWTPFRQVGQVTDILIFENSGNINVSNVNQITIGQLKIRNNTNLTLSPGAGNSRVITIRGGEGVDLIIEQGSGLKILANDPSLNLYLGSGATAEIYGTITVEGYIANYINAADPNSFVFMPASQLIQNSPGNIFGTTGNGSVILFKNNSTYIVNNPQALNPFGLPAPLSKVNFENDAVFKINTNLNSLSLSGRNYPHIVIEEHVNVNVTEDIISDFSATDITVKNYGSFTITNNQNSNVTPSFSITGDLNVNGNFIFANSPSNKINVHFAGSELQAISGNGVITFPENLGYVFIDNSIILYRDLVFNCSVNHTQGLINTNNFTLTINGHFITPEGSRNMRGVILNQPGMNSPVSLNINYSPENVIPEHFSLSQNYPNPFNPATKISYSVPYATFVTLKVFDINGKAVKTLVSSVHEAGYYTINFDAVYLSSGIYFYTLKSDSFTETRKMILSK